MRSAPLYTSPSVVPPSTSHVHSTSRGVTERVTLASASLVSEVTSGALAVTVSVYVPPFPIRAFAPPYEEVPLTVSPPNSQFHPSVNPSAGASASASSRNGS